MKKLLIYIADNNEGEQYFLKTAFSGLSEKKQVCFFHNGCELLSALSQLRFLPDFILMDLNMPKMNGLETLYILKRIEAWQHIPVIIFSTGYIESEVEVFMKYGAKAFLPKPLNMMDYPKILKSLIAETI